MTRQEQAPGPRGPTTEEPWTIERFERWLRVGLESYVLEDAGPVAFPEAAHHILARGSLTAGLAAFTSGLSAARRDNFKQALAQVLAALEPRERNLPVADQLLAVAVATTAYPILSVLARKIGGGFFGQADPDGRDGLFAMALYTAARLAAPGRQDARRCIRELIASDNFRPAHASTALLALCETDPHALGEHLQAPGLRSQLARQFTRYDPDGSVRRMVARDLLSIIGVEGFAEALANLDAMDAESSGGRPDDWLVEALLWAEDPPLLLDTGQEVTISRRDDPSQRVTLPRHGVGGRRGPAEPRTEAKVAAERAIADYDPALAGALPELF